MPPHAGLYALESWKLEDCHSEAFKAWKMSDPLHVASRLWVPLGHLRHHRNRSEAHTVLDMGARRTDNVLTLHVLVLKWSMSYVVAVQKSMKTQASLNYRRLSLHSPSKQLLSKAR